MWRSNHSLLVTDNIPCAAAIVLTYQKEDKEAAASELVLTKKVVTHNTRSTSRISTPEKTNKYYYHDSGMLILRIYKYGTI